MHSAHCVCAAVAEFQIKSMDSQNFLCFFPLVVRNYRARIFGIRGQETRRVGDSDRCREVAFEKFTFRKVAGKTGQEILMFTIFMSYCLLF